MFSTSKGLFCIIDGVAGSYTVQGARGEFIIYAAPKWWRQENTSRMGQEWKIGVCFPTLPSWSLQRRRS